MLPFDDDDEALMRKKIIKGGFEDPEWLSEGNPVNEDSMRSAHAYFKNPAI
jgi:hypothetical protein